MSETTIDLGRSAAGIHSETCGLALALEHTGDLYSCDRFVRHDRAPADVMLLYAEEDARRGRNDNCTCGSGRKWTHCHGSTTS
jgi:uncharacterized protein YchJ